MLLEFLTKLFADMEIGHVSIYRGPPRTRLPNVALILALRVS